MYKSRGFKTILVSLVLLVSLGKIAQALTYQEIYNYQTSGRVLGASTINLVAHTQSTSGASPAINTSGATLIVIEEFSPSVAPTDSLGNTWTGLATYNNGSIYGRYFYACGPSTGAAQTFTPGSGSVILVAAFSGTATSNCLDAGTDQGKNGAVSPGALPAITPSASGDLIVSSMIDNATTHPNRVPDSGLSVAETATSYAGGSLAWAQYNSANLLTVTWTQSPSWTGFGLAIAAFKPSSGGSSPDVTAPVIGNIQSSNLTQSAATITWTTDENSDSQITYGVTTAYGSLSALNSSLGTSHSVSLSGLSAATLYHYAVESRDVSGNLAVSADNTFTTSSLAPSDTTAPSVPAGLSATAVSSSGINLSWTASSDNVGVTGYKIFRGGVQVGTTVNNNYNDSSLSASTNYSYNVAAYDGAGNTSAQSSSANATTQAASSSASYSIGWNDLANTHLLSVCPSPSPGGVSGCSSVINTWSSAVLDTLRNRLVIWGGGHNDYYGNEVYSLNLGNTPPTLTRINNPSVVDFTTGGGCPGGTYCQTNPDGTPVARHTYNGIVYLPNQDALFSYGGNLSPNGSGTHSIWTFTMADNTWHRKDPVNGFDITAYSASPYGAGCAYDQNTANVFCVDQINSPFFKYNPSTNTNTKLANSINYPAASTPAIDPVHKQMVFMGLNNAGTGLAVVAVDISGNDPTYTAQDWSSATSGCSAMGVNWPGFTWDSAIQKFVGWPNTGNTVYIFDPVTKNCTSQSFSNGPTTVSTNGTYGRFAYVSSMDAFVVVNRSDGDAYVLKISNSGSLADTQAPTVPTGLSATAVSPTAINLSWSASGDNVGVAGYKIYRNGTQVGTSVSTGYADTALTASTNYSYTIAAYDSAGNNSVQSSSVSTITQSLKPPPVQTLGANLNGLGGSTLTCLDQDGDGYGVGPGCLGPDADDTDAAVHSGAQALAKWGTMTAFLAHIGYTPAHIWYLAPAVASPNCNTSLGSCVGNDSTGVMDDPNHPFQNWTAIQAAVTTNDLVMMRDNWNGFIFNTKSGTAGNPNIYMSFPGEAAYLNSATYSGASINILDKSWIVLDGIKATQAACFSGGSTASVAPTTFHDNIFRHLECTSGGGSQGLGGFSAFNGLVNITIEDNVFHDDNGANQQHEIYIGSRTIPSSNVIVRRNIVYNSNSYPIIQFNGRVTNLDMEQNVAYNGPGTSCFSWMEGVSNSVLKDNLCFNVGSEGLAIVNYDGDCYVTGSSGICPYDQTGNVIENNTFYIGSLDSDGAGSTRPAVEVVVLTSGCPSPVGSCVPRKVGNVGGNTFRNNIFVSNDGGTPNYPPVVFPMCTEASSFAGLCVLDTSDTSLATTQFVNNIFWNTGGHSGPGVVGTGPNPGFGYTSHTFAQLNSGLWAAGSTGNLNVDPMFVAASPSAYYQTPGSFNFLLQSSSPAIAAGTTLGAPTYDITGSTFNNPPSIGTYEYGSTGVVTPPSSDTTAPSVPTNLTAMAMSSSVINLSWTASTDNVGVSGYRIFRNGSQVGSVLSPGFSDVGLVPSTQYSYTVLAFDAAGNTSAPTSAVLVSTPALLPAISNLLGSNTTASTTVLSWNTNIPTNGQVFYGLDASYGNQSPVLNDSPLTISHSATLTGLTPSTLYHFKVTSVDASSNSTTTPDFTFTTLASSSPAAPPGNPLTGNGGTGGGGGGSSSSPGNQPNQSTSVTVYIPPAASNSSTSANPQSSTSASTGTGIKLLNLSGTYYLLQGGVLHGITNPGMLATYGFTFSQAQTPTSQELSLPKGSLLTPSNGSLVKSKPDPTVYLISSQTRYAFTSAQIFKSLGFKFSSVLTVTDPELQVLPKSSTLLKDGHAQHLPGLDILKNGTVYWIDPAGTIDPYPSVDVYNSWHIKNDFSSVVPANAADLALPVGPPDTMRVVN